ncbi:hypothetical protein N0V82_010200 [Gnomoniopsis sp. IMI 355080]|nr:hypothetical protein N0V82_010200 [Gnomoniopsis sp. IMI 355080]
MKANFALVVGLVNTVLAGPVAKRDDATELDSILAHVKVHTANINHTLATLPAANTTSSGNVTGNANITAEWNIIATTLNTTAPTLSKRSFPLFGRQDTVTCNATCQSDVYDGMGSLTAEIAYTAKACAEKNATDITSSSSVLIRVVTALATITNDISSTVGSMGGIVVQNLNAALGAEIGGELALFIAGS